MHNVEIVNRTCYFRSAGVIERACPENIDLRVGVLSQYKALRVGHGSGIAQHHCNIRFLDGWVEQVASL